MLKLFILQFQYTITKLYISLARADTCGDNVAKCVLISDQTLIYDYRNFPLLDFLPCAPTNSIPSAAYKFLKGRISPPVNGGRLKYAPYALRKLEAALLRKYSENDIVVAHPDHLAKFIKDDTEIIGVTTMDPFGLGLSRCPTMHCTSQRSSTHT